MLIVRRRVAFVLAVLGLLALPISTPAFAAEKDAAIVVDGATGKVLYERNADSPRYPASLTKMMTLYLLFEALERGTVTMETRITASKHAVNQEPTKLDVAAGDSIPVDIAIRAIVVRSANDVAVMIAEALGGSEEEFAAMMTRKARALGMTNTRFRNASGLPEAGQMTTARDLALLGRHLAYDFPQYYHYFSLDGFSYAGRNYVTHDNLLAQFDGADGIKTGYTRISGFNLVTSVVRANHHVVGVVMGGRTAHERDQEMMWMLAQVFGQAEHNLVALSDTNVPWHAGAGQRTNPFGAGATATVVAAAEPPRPAAPQPRTAPAEAPPPVIVAQVLPKPAAEDDRIGELIASIDDEDRAEAISRGPQGPPRRAPVPVANPRQGIQLARANAPPVAAPQPKPRRPTQLATLTWHRGAQPIEEGDIGDNPIPQPRIAPRVAPKPAVATVPRPPADSGQRRWAVQIGAFADQGQAQTQLAVYAERSMDVVGQARRIVTPFNGADGRKLFRARFGSFAESEAREVCRRMTQRGQTCFATASN